MSGTEDTARPAGGEEFRRAPARWLSGLCGDLRDAGLACSITESVLAAEAARLLDSDDAEEMYLGLRSAFCSSVRDLGVFETCFWRRWHEGTAPPRDANRSEGPGRREADDPAGRAPGHPKAEQPQEATRRGESPETARVGGAYSAADHLARRSFVDVRPHEIQELDSLIARLVVRLSSRRSRRLEAGGRRGPVDLRRSAAHAVRTEGEWLRLLRRRRKRVPPRIVVLCDISGSMERYSRFLVRFLLATARARDIHAFAFSTRLTYLSPWLRRSSLDDALEALRARGWSSGTRIGECLETFVDRHGTALLGRRTVVVILSDGLDQGEVAPLERAMGTIQRRARRVIWLNPLLESSRYAPEARGMRAALPFIDEFASGHNLAALARLPRLVGA